MEQMNLSFGRIGALHISLQWLTNYGSDGPIGKTWGSLQLWLGDTLVWGSRNADSGVSGVKWSWIDLLEFLGNAWPYLSEQEQFPTLVGNKNSIPNRVNEFWGVSRITLQSMSENAADEYDDRVRDFLVVHDLSEGLHGIAVPSILFLRRGNQMLVGNDKQEFVFDFNETMQTLEFFGSAIASQIENLTDCRSVRALARWKSCKGFDVVERLKISTNRSIESIKKIFPIDTLRSANDDFYQLKAAARMIGNRIADESLKEILHEIRSSSKIGKFKLDDLWACAKTTLAEDNSVHPAAEGYQLAGMLRDELDIIGRAEPSVILTKWGVRVKEISIPGGEIDAIALWGGGRIPTILLNVLGPRAKTPTGQRVTLAHEMCHILIDMDGALPATEVLGGEVPHVIEQRANAFAAEFLLPRNRAAEVIRQELDFVHSQAERLNSIERAVQSLSATYGASHETVAWQILNSDFLLKPNEEQVLRKKLKSIVNPY